MSSNSINQVKPLYMEQKELLNYKAIITQLGTSEINKKKYQWIQLNETIFHPKGGGQPSDEGTINGVKVIYVHKNIFDKSKLDQFEILHCFEEGQPLNFKIGDEVELKVDALKRKFYSRLHTAGHFVAEAVNKNFPTLEGYQGNHNPNDCYVKFKMLDRSIDYNKDEIKHKVKAELQSWIEQDIVVADVISSGIRSIKITQDWSPCGGTHVASAREIKSIDISDVSINKKEGTVTVKYHLPD